MRDRDLTRWRDAIADCLGAASALRDHGATARDLEAAAADLEAAASAIRAEAADLLEREAWT